MKIIYFLSSLFLAQVVLAQSGQRVYLFRSNNCQGDLIATLGSGVNCDTFGTSWNTAAVQIRGECVDLFPDMNTANACYAFKAGGNPYAAGLYRSDSCDSDKLLAYVDPSSDCNRLSLIANNQVWGVKMDGVCQNISDMDFLRVCEHFKGR